MLPFMAYPGSWRTEPETHLVALLAFILGIAGVTCCYFPTVGMTAFILGIFGRKAVAENPQCYSGSGFATAGMVLGGIGTVLATLWLIVQFVVEFNSGY